MIITFENGTTKAIRSDSTNIQTVNGGYFISDPSVSAAKTLQTKVVSQAVVSQLVKILVSIRFDNPIPSTLPPPDKDCLFNPSLPKCVAVNNQCPTTFAMNEDGQCFPVHERCPSGYHSHEDDESGRCIPDSSPCDPGYVMNPDFPSCDREEYVCDKYSELAGCKEKEPDPPVNDNCGIDPSQGVCLYEPQPGDPDYPKEPVAPQPQPQPDPQPQPEPDPEPEPDPGDGDQNEGEENENENRNEDSGGDGDGSTDEEESEE